MNKFALLIGVSDYELGLQPLPSAIRDIHAIERVLVHPDMGDFDKKNIQILENPARQAMEESIELLFSKCRKDDLVLLFFSGHGIKDDTGILHLSSVRTRKTDDGGLVRSTAVSASFIQQTMNRSRAKRQVVILDCCFSGAFLKGMSAKDDGTIDIKSQLGGEGRVILTSSASTQYSFEEEDDELSIYTRYLVEGIETGVADEDHDGKIAVNELHDYVKRKVQEATPSMKPEFHPFQDGFKIYLANAPSNSPELQYRRSVEKWIKDSGEISGIARTALDICRSELKLPTSQAYAIEQDVLSPHHIHRQKLAQYEYTFLGSLQKSNPPDDKTRKELTRLQHNLGLDDAEVENIENRVLGFQKDVETKPEKNNTEKSLARKIIFKSVSDITKKIFDLSIFVTSQGVKRTKVLIKSSFQNLPSIYHFGARKTRESWLSTKETFKASSILIGSRKGITTVSSILVITGMGAIIYITDHRAQETKRQAISLKEEGDFSGCSSTVNNIPVYTRLSIHLSKESKRLLASCNDSFKQEELAIEKAHSIVSNLSQSEEDTVNKLEETLDYLNKVSSLSSLNQEVEKLSNNLLWELKQIYQEQEKFQVIQELVQEIPNWTKAYSNGNEWIESELPLRTENVIRQTNANQLIREASDILQSSQEQDRIVLAKEKLEEAEQELKAFPNNLSNWWERTRNNIELRLDNTRSEVNLQENIIQECRNQYNAYWDGDIVAINNILFLRTHLNSKCSQAGITLPNYSDLRYLLENDKSLCQVIATSLNLRSYFHGNKTKITTLQSGMLIRRKGSDFKSYSGKRWIRVSTGVQQGWVAAMNQGTEYVSNCLTSWEKARGDFRF